MFVFVSDEPEHKEELESVADQLAKIADEIPFASPEPDLETDSPNGEFQFPPYRENKAFQLKYTILSHNATTLNLS